MLFPGCTKPYHRIGEARPRSEKRKSLELELERKRRYLLEVQIEVAATKQREFSQIGANFLEAFKRSDLTLVTSAWRPDSGPVRAVNYWDMGNDANVLFEAELALPDIPGFTKFNRLIQNEVKNIVVPIAGDQSVPIPEDMKIDGGKLPARDFRYLRVTCKVPTERLVEFQIRVEESLVSFARAVNWYFGDTYLGITGQEGSVSQVWVIPTESSFEVGQRLEEAPWLSDDLLEQSPSFQIMQATPSDPIIGSAKAQ